MSLIEVEKIEEVAVVHLLVKRLDASNALAFKEEVVTVVHSGETRLVLDMGKVEFVDSSGLGAMVSVFKALGGKGAVVVCNVGSAVMNLFKLTRMDKVFSIVPDTEQAVARARA